LGENSSGNGEKKGNYEHMYYMYGMYKCRLDNWKHQEKERNDPKRWTH